MIFDLLKSGPAVASSATLHASKGGVSVYGGLGALPVGLRYSQFGNTVTHLS